MKINRNLMDRKLLIVYPKDYSFNGIDLIKYLCSYLVCMIHIKPIVGIDGNIIGYFNYAAQNGFSRIAVPFFFVASGFLLFRKNDLHSINLDRTKNYCHKMLILLGLWTVILFIGGQTQLWYLGGSVIAVVLLTAFLQRGYSFLKIGCLTGGIFVLGLLFDSYSGLVKIVSERTGLSFLYDFALFLNNDVTRTLRLGLFSGLLFIFIGIVYVYKPIKMKLWVSFVGFILSMVALTAESFAIKHTIKSLDHNIYVSLIPAVFFLFYIATHIKLKNRIIYKALREIGVLIFFTHLFVYKILNLFSDWMNNYFNVNLTYFLFILTLVLTTALSVFVRRLSQKEKFSWIKRIYS